MKCAPCMRINMYVCIHVHVHVCLRIHICVFNSLASLSKTQLFFHESMCVDTHMYEQMYISLHLVWIPRILSILLCIYLCKINMHIHTCVYTCTWLPDIWATYVRKYRACTCIWIIAYTFMGESYVHASCKMWRQQSNSRLNIAPLVLNSVSTGHVHVMNNTACLWFFLLQKCINWSCTRHEQHCLFVVLLASKVYQLVMYTSWTSHEQ